MVASERANKRRRLSTDPINSVETPTKANDVPAEPGSRSTGRSTRVKTDVKAGASDQATEVAAAASRTDRRTPRSSTTQEGARQASVTPAGPPMGNGQASRTPTNGSAVKGDGRATKSTEKATRRRTAGNDATATQDTDEGATRPSARKSARPQLKSPANQMRNFDEAFQAPDKNGAAVAPLQNKGEDEDENGDGSPEEGEEPISREAFLHNEQLKRLRDARNFVYSGEADAPKQTRSGRVVAAAAPSISISAAPSPAPDTPTKIAAHINPASARTPSRRPGQELATTGVIAANPAPPTSVAVDLGTPTRTALTPAATPRGKRLGGARQLPDGARPYLERTMAILTGAEDMQEQGPEPMDGEETNEALKGLVNVLRGTVCRGEGNSALLVGPRGAGKTRTINRALHLLRNPSGLADPAEAVPSDAVDGVSNVPTPAAASGSIIPPAPPIIVRLSGHAQTNDRLAIREMGRQIALAEGHASFNSGEDVEADEDQEYAPTTLPSHLLALLTAPSARAIVIVMEELDLFTEHARQALLYCLLDVVQSIKTGPVESTGRGVALVGVTSRTDTLLLLEKRVKSRFSHRVWRIASPLSPASATLAVPAGDKAWRVLLKRALVPWSYPAREPQSAGVLAEEGETKRWKTDWNFAIDMLLKQEKVIRYFDRLTSLTTDVRNLYRPLIPLIPLVLSSTNDFLSVPLLTSTLLAQVDGAGWGLANAKLKGLSQPCLTVLAAAKHLSYAGKDEFNFAQVNEEYVRFARTRLVGSGRTRWVEGVLRRAFDQMINLGLLVPVSNATIKPHFARYRCTLSTHEIVAWFKGDGASSLGPELGNWGRMMGGHA